MELLLLNLSCVRDRRENPFLINCHGFSPWQLIKKDWNDSPTPIFFRGNAHTSNALSMKIFIERSSKLVRIES